MAERELSAPPASTSAPTYPTKRVTPHPWAQRAVEDLRGTPADAPSLDDALPLRQTGRRLVVVYCRVSTDAHKRDGHAARDQATHCGRIAVAQGLVIVHRYVDNHKSASKPGIWRPDFEEMLEALRLGATASGYPVDGIVCTADDRLYRDPHTFERFRAAFTTHPERIYVDALGRRDLYDEAIAARAAEAALAARAESLKQQQRAQMNHRARAERGEPISVRRPFGWNEDKVTLHPGESAVVRQGVRDLINGSTLSAVTRVFTASGYPTSLGNTWQRQTVKQILRNPRICGYRTLRGKLLADDRGVPVIGQWEPIVSPDEWRAASDRLSTQRRAGGWNGKNPIPSPQGKYLLTSLLRCGAELLDGSQCGAQMHGAPYGATHIYRCRSGMDGGCGRTSRQGRAVDRLVAEWSINKALEAGLLGDKPPTWPGERDLQLARRHRAALEGQWHAQEITDTQYFSQLRTLEEDIKRLVTVCNTWCAQLSIHRPQVLGELPSAWMNLSHAQQQELLHRLLAAVVVLPALKGSHHFDSTRIVPVWRDQP
ncbi:recombinase family protein [Streptomyces sp. NPDC001661]